MPKRSPVEPKVDEPELDDPFENKERKNLKRSDPRSIVAKIRRRGKITRRDKDVKGHTR